MQRIYIHRKARRHTFARRRLPPGLHVGLLLQRVVGLQVGEVLLCLLELLLGLQSKKEMGH